MWPRSPQWSARFATLRTRIPPPWLDGGLAALVLVVQLWPLLTRVPPDGIAWDWWGYAAAGGASLPLVVRRLAPITVAIVTIVFSGLYDLADHVAPQPVWYGPLLAMYTVAAHCA
ncbi:MAG: hypothetical protein HOV86_19510, partial [Thermoactinospora sp.]|nr:hypothetical protein [Thermoactinospora sp.]